MNKKISLIATAVVVVPVLMSFCGFYVSKADGGLKNKTSQVILVRDGNKNVITMYNDFKGNTKDFAMVVPVPVVLKKEDIKVVSPTIFATLNDYSAPRLVEYWDQNPCNRYEDKMDMAIMAPSAEVVTTANQLKKYSSKSTVTIEAQYLVGEYDILILSAKESTGLKNWLTDNGYKIPAEAEEVLDPYIKSNLKFFVVKVNEKEKAKLNNNFLRPIQISFTSPKFMLPIRLGMANADGDQDLIVYGFSRKGRIECTNYRTVPIVTGNKIPLFVKNNFSSFYSNLFNRQWQTEGKNVAFLEYAWNVTPVNQMKCDPCVGNPPTAQDLVQSGIWWLNGKNWDDYSDVDNEDDYSNTNVHFTRLHVRYNRTKFAQDLVFQVTPNTENYQARYAITHPATGDLSCIEGQNYLKELKKRRKTELQELTNLTNTNLNNWQEDATTFATESEENNADYTAAINEINNEIPKEKNVPVSIFIFGGLVIATAGLLKFKGLV